MRGSELVLLGVVLVFLGMFLMVAGSLLQAAKAGRDAEVRGGGVVLIGPIPIVFGSDTESVKTVLVLTMVLIVAVYLMFFRRVV